MKSSKGSVHGFQGAWLDGRNITRCEPNRVPNHTRFSMDSMDPGLNSPNIVTSHSKANVGLDGSIWTIGKKTAHIVERVVVVAIYLTCLSLCGGRRI